MVISLTLFACSVEANNVCSLRVANADKVVKFDGVPGFFFKVHPDGNLISFIESDHNTMIDLNTGKEFATVGYIDPVWAPDGKFMTHPGGNQTEGENLKFYHGDDIIKKTLEGKAAEAKAFVSKHEGVYQSIGVLGNDKYNIISDHNGITIGEYSYSERGPVQTSELKKPCGNIPDLPTNLPMLSKDGKYLAAHGGTPSTTKIFKLNGDKCELALDLGFGTGKVSFNNDSSQIAFHVDQFSEFDSGYFSGVGKDKVKNVVVLNLEEDQGKLIPTEWAMASHNVRPGNGAYYPDYDKHGNVYYMEDIDNNFQFVKVTPENLEFRPMEKDLLFGKNHCVSCQGAGSEKSATDILAKMWMDACPKDNFLPMNHFRELVMAIDPLECKKMVNDFWLDSLGVSKEQLLSTCPQKLEHKPLEVGAWNPNQKAEAEAILKGKCISCHRTQKTYEAEDTLWVQTGPTESTEEKITVIKKMGPINLEKLDYEMANKMMQSIHNGDMPKKEPLSANDKKTLIDYLQKRTLDMNQEGYNDYLNVRRYTEENLEKERQSALQQMPEATPEQRKMMINMVNCVFGQKNCTEYLESQKPGIEYEAVKLPVEQQQKYRENKMMELRCSNLIEVTPQQCIDWAASNRVQPEKNTKKKGP